MEEKYCEIEERRIPIRMEDRQGRAASQATRESEVLQKFADRVVPATAEEIDLWLRMHPPPPR